MQPVPLPFEVQPRVQTHTPGQKAPKKLRTVVWLRLIQSPVPIQTDPWPQSLTDRALCHEWTSDPSHGV